MVNNINGINSSIIPSQDSGSDQKVISTAIQAIQQTQRASASLRPSFQQDIYEATFRGEVEQLKALLKKELADGPMCSKAIAIAAERRESFTLNLLVRNCTFQNIDFTPAIRLAIQHEEVELLQYLLVNLGMKIHEKVICIGIEEGKEIMIERLVRADWIDREMFSEITGRAPLLSALHGYMAKDQSERSSQLREVIESAHHLLAKMMIMIEPNSSVREEALDLIVKHEIFDLLPDVLETNGFSENSISHAKKILESSQDKGIAYFHLFDKTEPENDLKVVERMMDLERLDDLQKDEFVQAFLKERNDPLLLGQWLVQQAFKGNPIPNFDRADIEQGYLEIAMRIALLSQRTSDLKSLMMKADPFQVEALKTFARKLGVSEFLTSVQEQNLNRLDLSDESKDLVATILTLPLEERMAIIDDAIQANNTDLIEALQESDKDEAIQKYIVESLLKDIKSQIGGRSIESLNLGPVAVGAPKMTEDPENLRDLLSRYLEYAPEEKIILIELALQEEDTKFLYLIFSCEFDPKVRSFALMRCAKKGDVKFLNILCQNKHFYSMILSRVLEEDLYIDSIAQKLEELKNHNRDNHLRDAISLKLDKLFESKNFEEITQFLELNRDPLLLGYALVNFCHLGKIDLVKKVIQNGALDPGYLLMALKMAVATKKMEILKTLYPFASPAICNALDKFAVMIGQEKVLPERLEQLPKVAEAPPSFSFPFLPNFDSPLKRKNGPNADGPPVGIKVARLSGENRSQKDLNTQILPTFHGSFKRKDGPHAEDGPPPVGIKFARPSVENPSQEDLNAQIQAVQIAFADGNEAEIQRYLATEKNETSAREVAECFYCNEERLSKISTTKLSRQVRLALFRKGVEKQDDRLCGALILDAKTAWEFYSSGSLDLLSSDFKEKLKRHFSLAIRLNPQTVSRQNLKILQQFLV